MKIVQVEISHYRGINKCVWHPSPLVNCLIGAGDSTKTTILDAIELALNPRQNFLLEDADFYGCDTSAPVEITVTLADLPSDFKSEDRYGLFLRGWNSADKLLVDEPATGLDDALSIRVQAGDDLEVRWGLFNDRIARGDDPPALRFKDAQRVATVRLGPYHDRHFAWGRQSALHRLDASREKVSSQLAASMRAAREVFKSDPSPPFEQASELVESLSKKFSVGIKTKYRAALDLQSATISAGGIALHDGDLPLRSLGTGSARLVVAAIQHNVGASAPFALIDEVEHGLEPHRIARLIKLLKEPDENGRVVQSFFTTHSITAVMEMSAGDLLSVRSKEGTTVVASAESAADSLDEAQRHLRACPDAFLAPKVLVCEGETEHGLCRAFDHTWALTLPSFALCGVVAVSGGGTPKAFGLAKHLAKLGHDVFLLLDGDKPLDQPTADALTGCGVKHHVWPDGADTERRLFLDLPWAGVQALVRHVFGDDAFHSGRNSINARCDRAGVAKLTDLSLPIALDSPSLRTAIAQTASENGWFKSVSGGEQLGELIKPHMRSMASKPFGEGIALLRGWIDAGS